MKRRWALVGGMTIQAVVEQDGEPHTDGDWHEIGAEFGPGDAFVDGLAFKAGSQALTVYLSARDKKGGS